MPGTINIKNGALEVVFSGSIIVNSADPTVFTITDDGAPLDVIFRFESSDTEKNSHLKAKSIEANKVEFIFYNFNDVLGTWSTELVPVGGMYDRELWMNYHISDLVDKSRQIDFKKINFSFYLGDPFGTSPIFKKGGGNG